MIFFIYSITAQSISEAIEGTYSRFCHETIGAIKKCEEIQSNVKDIGESYYRLAIHCLKLYRSGSNENNKLDMCKLIIKSVLRGMRYNSKNARLQFPRLLKLQMINSNELAAVFDDEVTKNNRGI